MAKILKTNGEISDIKPRDGKAFSLEEMQTIVGGYIEVFRMADGRLMVINEEGKDKDLELNMKASEAIRWQDLIAGDALICSADEIQPYKQVKKTKKANPNDIVTITCYRKTEKMTRREAMKKYHEGMLCCEGSERERYATIYGRLQDGLTEVSDTY